MKDCEKSGLTRSEAECEVCDEAMGAEIVYQVITYLSKNLTISNSTFYRQKESPVVEEIRKLKK